MSDRYDVIIIGTGAGGGTLAHRLAPSGKKILILERGQFLPRERENWDMRAVAGGRYQTQEHWYDKGDQPFRPYTHYWVGGNTKMYGAALLRLREDDFEAVQHYGGISPAWPLKYPDFEPYYTEAEHLYQVHGERGIDPTDPPASAPYPFPPLPFEPRMGEVYEQLESNGYRPFPIPLGLRTDEGSGVPSSLRAPAPLSYFDGYPDPLERKADAHVIAVQPALGQERVTLWTGAYAERLETDSSGKRVTGVVVRRDREMVTVEADVVVAACGAVNSAALLLRSANDKHPYGLANRSSLVGRNFMAHNNGTFIMISDTPNPSQFQKAFGLTDFYRGSDDSDLPLGAVQLMGKMDLDGLYAAAHARVPGMPAEELSGHAIEFFLTSEDLPRAENRVTIRADGSIKLERKPNNLTAYRRLYRKMMEVMGRCCCPTGQEHLQVYVGEMLSISGVSHQNGTLRFGPDPNMSVLDLHCKAHDLDNLYVVDGSFFPASGAVNPSLTIIANALRVGDHLLDRLG
jgi:choline dehydrogenase-like flavoprotein